MKLQAYRPKILFEKKRLELFAVLMQAVLFALAGLLLAHWMWIFFAPAPLELPPKIEQTPSTQLTTLLAAQWFTPPNGQQRIEPPPVDFKLVGIYASANSKPGFAVFKLADGKQRAVLLHQEIIPGVVLQDIQKNEVEVGQSGSTKKMLLEKKSSISNGLINTRLNQ